MPKKILIQVVVIISLLFPSLVLSQPREIKNYTVKKGDTLWSISHAELGDSFLWPKVWKENPDISNPDRLYPGQIVKIPIYLKQPVREEKTEPVAAAAPMPIKPANQEKKEVKEAEKEQKVTVPLKPLIDNALFTACGYISDSVPSVGIIDGSPSGRTLLGSYDTVFLKTDNPVETGDKFVVIKALRLQEPEAMRNSGYIIEPVAVVEISKIDGNDVYADIVRSFGPVRAGDLLDDYHDMDAPLMTGDFRKPDIEGVVIAARNLQLMNSIFDIVYIDKGLNDGIEIGDMFRTVDVSSGHSIPTGTIQVIGARDTTSTAVVRKNIGGAISAGNLFIQLK